MTIFHVSYLEHGDKVDVVPVNHFVNELDELVDKALVLLEPRGVKVEAERGTVGGEVAVEVVPQEAAKLLRGEDVGARGDQVATGQALIKVRVVPTVKLVDDHLPDRVAPGGAVLGISVALVGHAVVQSVGPDGNTTKRSSDRGVIDKELKE